MFNFIFFGFVSSENGGILLCLGIGRGIYWSVDCGCYIICSVYRMVVVEYYCCVDEKFIGVVR